MTSYAIDGAEPHAVEYPQRPEDVAALLKSAEVAGQAVVPWGAGTKQGMGNRPRRYDVALDLRALDAVLEYEPADLVVTVQAGTPLAALQQRLAASGQFLALDPPYAERATVGGTLATNASGPSRLLYGTARDLVLGMRVATPEGHLVKSGGKVVKNVVGYDLNKMHVGGFGTLGVMVEVTMKVHPLPRAEATIAAAFDSLAAAHAAAGRLVRSNFYPRAIELVRAPIEGLPASSGWRVLVWAAGSPATVDRQVREADDWLGQDGAEQVASLEDAAHAAVWRAVREFGRDDGDQITLIKLTCLPSQLAALCGVVERLAVEQLTEPLQLVAHAGSGVLYVRLSGSGATSPTLVRQVVAAGLDVGGTGVVERAPAEVRSHVDTWGPIRGDFALMQALKSQFDPHSTLNPGRFVGGI